jgi:hypothetical protein
MAKFPSGAAVGRSRVLWQRAPRNVTLKTALADVRSRLLDAIVHAADTAQIREPVYCLLLVYDLENPEFPPTIAFGFESERRTSRQRYGAEASCHVWNPVELQWHRRSGSELRDAALRRSCRILEVSPGLIRSARFQLWSRKPVTDDPDF